MSFNNIDYFLIGLFLCGVFYIILKNLFSKQSSDNYFRAGGNIHWMLIGCSLIAADMSLSYVVGCSGMGFDKGIAIGSYEWTAAIAMIFVALYILPKFMALGVLTLPEYLELRFNSQLRLMVSILIIAAHIISALATSFFSTAVLIEELFHLDPSYLQWLIWGSGLLTCAIILSGGLSAMVRTNAVIVILLLLGGLIVVSFCLVKVGGFDNFMAHADSRMDAVLPADDPMLPWTQVFLGSLWILHLYYWAFNQFIVQTMLASSSLSGAQKGMLFAGTIKLIIPFIFFIPGIVGYELYQGEVSDPDRIFPIILREIIPSGIKGFILIAFMGTVIGATNAILNACSTIFSHDIYKRFMQKDASDDRMILVSRISVVVFVMLSCFLAPNLQNFQNVFEYSQYIAGAISPILAAIFLFGIYSKKTPAAGALVSFLVAIPVYILLIKYGLRIGSFFAQVELFDATFLAEFFGSLSALQFAGINFLLTCSILLFFRLIKPIKNPQNLQGKRNIRFERNLVVVVWSIFLFTLVGAIYIVFL